MSLFTAREELQLREEGSYQEAVYYWQQIQADLRYTVARQRKEFTVFSWMHLGYGCAIRSIFTARLAADGVKFVKEEHQCVDNLRHTKTYFMIE